MRRAEGGAIIVGVFRVKNHDFTPKIVIFSNFRGRGGQEPGAPLNTILNWFSLTLVLQSFNIDFFGCWIFSLRFAPPVSIRLLLYLKMITLLAFFIEMLQYDCLWSGHMILEVMFHIPMKLKSELARASTTTSDVNNQWRINFQQQII